MNISISGLTSTDCQDLSAELADLGGTYAEDDSLGHGHADMGLFTIGVPLTLAVVGVIKVWIKERTPGSEFEISDETGSVRYKVSGGKANADDVEAILKLMHDARK